ncbi:Helix-turn-helix domain-containing protein [Thermomonospora echinospora]|uniref:Helix-turn-helix domain-containing protein n=1 Tax=Thermomonospora echinospora TaxID=1992 RepID=A0A1H5ZGE1_9ACTN|nr:helix-turn-helix transcriptional regulator [Thermomonospora echinospora]SEG35508.1 Helix-turn-helix domain-containing protein [Thermomonospora echinospora]
MSGNELGAFLRARREAITPAEVGLPAGIRRRTPGLRRSELATLAGISVEYLTRLEQGRDRHPSFQVLGALADALRLSLADRTLLLRAAKGEHGPGMCLGAAAPPARTVRPTVRALLDTLEPAPALLLNRLSDVIAHTSGYARLAAPLGVLQGHPPNLIRYLFTDPRARAAHPEWDRVADEQVARLRNESTRSDPHVAELTNELSLFAGAVFTDRLAAPPSAPPRTGVHRLVHPHAGELRLAYETLDLSADDDQCLLVYLPADEATSAALDRLTGRRPGALRAVNDHPAAGRYG